MDCSKQTNMYFQSHNIVYLVFYTSDISLSYGNIYTSLHFNVVLTNLCAQVIPNSVGMCGVWPRN